MLSLQITNDHSISIFIDKDGLDRLRLALNQLEKERAGHRHLWGASAGGSQLDEKTPFGDRAVSEVIINYLEASE